MPMIRRNAALLALSAALVAGHAMAAMIERTDYQAAAGICQGALPVFSATLRARPLGILNEGSQTAFVTCALQGDNTVARGATALYLRVSNGTGAPATVSCTLVNGFGNSNSFTPVYVPKTANLPANAGTGLVWEPADLGNGSSTISFPQFSCALPPGASIHYISRTYQEEVL